MQYVIIQHVILGGIVVSFHVYVEPELQDKLDALCKKTGRKRNALVREALRDYVEKQAVSAWPPSFFDFKADQSFPRFESLRDDLAPDRDNIFGDDDQ
jgi:hypothetical protein